MSARFRFPQRAQRELRYNPLFPRPGTLNSGVEPSKSEFDKKVDRDDDDDDDYFAGVFLACCCYSVLAVACSLIIALVIVPLLQQGACCPNDSAAGSAEITLGAGCRGAKQTFFPGELEVSFCVDRGGGAGGAPVSPPPSPTDAPVPPPPPTVQPPTGTPQPPTSTPQPPTITPQPPTTTPQPPTVTPQPPTVTPQPPTGTPAPTAPPPVPVPPGTGACCIREANMQFQGCIDFFSEQNCNEYIMFFTIDGTISYTEGMTCAEVSCVPTDTSSCCQLPFPSDTCTDGLSQSCLDLGGTQFLSQECDESTGLCIDENIPTPQPTPFPPATPVPTTAAPTTPQPPTTTQPPTPTPTSGSCECTDDVLFFSADAQCDGSTPQFVYELSHFTNRGLLCPTRDYEYVVVIDAVNTVTNTIVTNTSSTFMLGSISQMSPTNVQINTAQLNVDPSEFEVRSAGIVEYSNALDVLTLSATATLVSNGRPCDVIISLTDFSEELTCRQFTDAPTPQPTAMPTAPPTPPPTIGVCPPDYCALPSCSQFIIPCTGSNEFCFSGISGSPDRCVADDCEGTGAVDGDLCNAGGGELGACEFNATLGMSECVDATDISPCACTPATPAPTLAPTTPTPVPTTSPTPMPTDVMTPAPTLMPVACPCEAAVSFFSDVFEGCAADEPDTMYYAIRYVIDTNAPSSLPPSCTEYDFRIQRTWTPVGDNADTQYVVTQSSEFSHPLAAPTQISEFPSNDTVVIVDNLAPVSTTDSRFDIYEDVFNVTSLVETVPGPLYQSTVFITADNGQQFCSETEFNISFVTPVPSCDCLCRVEQTLTSIERNCSQTELIVIRVEVNSIPNVSPSCQFGTLLGEFRVDEQFSRPANSTGEIDVGLFNDEPTVPVSFFADTRIWSFNNVLPQDFRTFDVYIGADANVTRIKLRYVGRFGREGLCLNENSLIIDVEDVPCMA